MSQMKRSSKRAMLFMSVLLVVGVVLSGCVTLKIFRAPNDIARGTSSSQWFGRVTPVEGSPADGTHFQFMVWLHVPDDWQLPWATQWSFTGNFANVPMSQDFGALTYISNDCSAGGSPDSGYKWRAFAGPIEVMPAARLTNQVNLRGGITVPSNETVSTYQDVRVIFGMKWDSDADNVPDTYTCSAGGTTVINVH